METLGNLIAAVANNIQEPSISTTDITAMLNRGQMEIAGGATRGYDVPTLPALPELSTFFDIDTVPGANETTMPVTFQRDAWYGFNANKDGLKWYESLIRFKKCYNSESGKSGVASAFCVIGRTLYYSNSPATAETLSIHGYRYPTDMSAETDNPDGIPVHLQYRLLVNYACMEFFGTIEQDMGGPGYNFQKHSALYSAAIKDLHDAIPKDQPDEYIEVDNAQFINSVSF